MSITLLMCILEYRETKSWTSAPDLINEYVFYIINGRHFKDGNHIYHEIKKDWTEFSLFTMALLQYRKATNCMVTLCIIYCNNTTHGPYMR